MNRVSRDIGVLTHLKFKKKHISKNPVLNAIMSIQGI